MKQAVLLLTACLAVLADLLIPQQLWVNQSCCHTRASLVAPTRVNFCSGPETFESASGELKFEALTCCKTTEYSLRANTPQAVEVPAAAVAAVGPLALPAPLPLKPQTIKGTSHTGHWKILWADPPPGPEIYLRHSRLNL